MRSVAIRLRRELQHVGFLTPLELEQAIILSDNDKSNVHQSLIKVGYNDAEIERCLKDSLQRYLITIEGEDRLSIREDRRTIVRRYFLLDTIVQYGVSANNKSGLVGSIIVSGYGPFFGNKVSQTYIRSSSSCP